ncbi:MAG: hypothetical protein A4E49_01069 [Methanosaeta sp. PtaU1.Bin112]|nr:MAG: hypothetical protein A4E49_01069 [Methanosaeta sp. PtaU1.Bin112]
MILIGCHALACMCAGSRGNCILELLKEELLSEEALFVKVLFVKDNYMREIDATSRISRPTVLR